MAKQSTFPELTAEQEARLQRRIRERGLTFETFLPEGLADWLKGQIADGVYESPREAAFVAFTQLRDMHDHPEVQTQLLKAIVTSAMNDPRPPIPADEVFETLRAKWIDLARED